MTFQVLALASLGILTAARVLAFDVERCITFLAILINLCCTRVMCCDTCTMQDEVR
jgi:hypothetical protein